MNFSIHIDDQTAKRLEQEAARRRRPRNALIAEAVKQWLERIQPTHWPADLLQFKGAPKLAPFEAHRSKKKQGVRFP
jgi:hypothetical protein